MSKHAVYGNVMLISLDLKLIINPAEYAGTLALEFSGGRLLAGRNYPFHEHERGMPVPAHTIEEDGSPPARAIYILDRPPLDAATLDDNCYRWHYEALVEDPGGHVHRSHSYELVLECYVCDDSGECLWSVFLDGPGAKFTITLPDYQPGYLTRLVSGPHKLLTELTQEYERLGLYNTSADPAEQPSESQDLLTAQARHLSWGTTHQDKTVPPLEAEPQPADAAWRSHPSK